MISQERLKELFSYSQDTGEFTRLVTIGPSPAGTVAGSISDGYIRINIDGKRYRAHHLAWLYVTGEWPKDQIDHKDHVRNNNKWLNLREVTHGENHRNKPLRSDNKSGTVGVSWNNPRSKWEAHIKYEQRKINLGLHADINAAILTRKVAEFAYGFHPNHGKAHHNIKKQAEENG